MLVGYGIAAFVILVLLIVFNVRAASRRTQQTATAQGNEAPESTAAVEQVKSPDESAMGDTSYRKALRQFQTQPSISGDTQSKTKPSISDTDYRAALRKQKSGRKDNE